MGIIYAAGPIEMGIMAVGSKYNANARESNIPMLYQNLNAPFDEWVSIKIFYGKYFNGRFFLNAEFAALNQDIRPVGALPLFVETRHFFVESGVVEGPARLSLIAAHTTGPAFNDPNPTRFRLPFAINYQTLEPYEWLMFDTYAGGNNGGWTAATVPLTNDEHGQLADGYAFAARLDYAIAANLNVWGSYIWAHATEHAAGFAGGVASDGGVGNTTATEAQNWKALNTGFPAAGLNPYVDDGFLGWEVNTGIDWKLLENMTLRLRWAYWQPGEWFDQAYQAVTVRGGAVVTDGLLIGRDPINAFECKMRIDF